jgi:hypothetical protein
MYRMLLAIALFAPANASFAQTVVVSWTGRNLTSSPAKINEKTTATITVTGVNDVLYVYSIQVTAVPQPTSDLDNIAKAFGLAAKAGEGSLSGACPPILLTAAQNSTQDLESALTAFYQSPVKQSAACSAQTPCSIDLKETRTIWSKLVTPKGDAAQKALKALQLPICQNTYFDAIKSLQTATDNVLQVGAYLSSDNHSISTQVSLVPDESYTVEVKELYLGAQTTG